MRNSFLYAKARILSTSLFILVVLLTGSSARLLAEPPAGAPASAALDGPSLNCPSWKPTWGSATLPNGRSQPYIRIPLDKSAFQSGILGPVLPDGRLPVIELYVLDANGALSLLAVSNEILGTPPPAPASVRVFWDEPAGGFPRAARIVVRMQVRVVAPGPFSADRPNAQPAWLRYDMPGAIPVIDRSAMGPVQVGGDGSYAPNQQMLDGSKAAAFHASLRVGLPAVSAGRPSDRIYLVSDNLISTREQDDSTRIRLGAGWVRSLPTQELDIAPNISTEAWVQSNQASSNQGAGFALGRLVLGRRWRKTLGRDFLYAALTPRIQLYPLQYTYLFRRDLRLESGFTQKSYVDPSAELLLSPFFIGVKPGQTATIENTANLSLEVRGWWVSGLGAEYRYAARLQIPVRIWHLSAVGISYYRGADENSYFRYSSGVSFDFSVRRGRLF